MQQIAPNTYASTEFAGVNVGFFVMREGALAVDSPALPRDARAWRQQILDTARVPILYVLVTDGHPDRVLSARLLGAPIIAGKGALDQILTYSDGYWRSAADWWARRFPDDAADLSVPRVRQPEIVLMRRLTIHRNGVDITIHEVQGAAPGSCWLHLPDQGVLFAGDTVVVGTHPWIASAPDTRAWLNTLAALRRPRFVGTQIVPGRGPVCESAATQDMSAYLVLARRRVRSLLGEGRSRGEVGGLVPEFLDRYPVPSGERDSVQRRIRVDLERVYDELAEAGD
jgi:glyoxylase-like metal-dependent hydrolase (beta-lactamase superfamily II)